MIHSFLKKKLASSWRAPQEYDAKFIFPIHLNGIRQFHDNCKIATCQIVATLAPVYLTTQKKRNSGKNRRNIMPDRSLAGRYEHRTIYRIDLLKARCTPEKMTILTKHSKTFFFSHVVKNIVNYQLQKLYLKRTSIKGSNYTFATLCHSALIYL